MIDDNQHSYVKYLPVLKWRQGEYQALLRLDKSIKKLLYPLFVIPPVEYDFEEQKPKKTAEEHVEKLARRYWDKWGALPCLLDIDPSLHLDSVKDGRTIPEFIFDEISSIGGHFSPVIHLDYDVSYIRAVKKTYCDRSYGIGIRVSLDELADPSSYNKIEQLLIQIGCNSHEVDLIVDFRKGANYKPTEDVVCMTSTLLGVIPKIATYRSIYVIGTSLELEMVKKPGAEQERDDWAFYKQLHSALKADFPNLGFGDYTVETPDFTSLDMRMMKPAAKLVYSYEDKWLVYKGGSFRDNPSQMKTLCNSLISSPHNYFYGKNFSPGDKKISDCSTGACGTGNLSTWKEASISHHLTLVVSQIANLNGSQKLP